MVILVGDGGGTTLRKLKLSNSSLDAFFFDLLIRSLQQKKEESAPRVPAYIAPWSHVIAWHVMPGTWRPPIGSLGLTLTRGSLAKAT